MTTDTPTDGWHAIPPDDLAAFFSTPPPRLHEADGPAFLDEPPPAAMPFEDTGDDSEFSFGDGDPSEGPDESLGSMVPVDRPDLSFRPTLPEGPELPWWTPGRLLRRLAGVDERLVRRVWHDRSRHTSLGGIILGTGVIAGFSMLLAINESLGHVAFWNVIPALIWLVFIINMDRMLVSTMTGSGRRFGSLVMRVLLAVLFGFIIAEPLTVRIFQPAIEKQIQDERSADLDALRTQLLACNTEEQAAGDAVVTPECALDQLTFAASPVALQQQVDAQQKLVDQQQTLVDTENKELNSLVDKARSEEDGTGGSMVVGCADICQQEKQDILNYEAAHPIADDEKTLATMRKDLGDLQTQLKDAKRDFEQKRQEAVDARVAEEKSHQGEIGLLERMNSLNGLTEHSFVLAAGVWLVRLLFVAIDVLPVVTKFSAGESAYDRLAKTQTETSVDWFEQEQRVVRRQAEHEVERRDAEHEVAGQEQRVKLQARRIAAENARADQILRQSRASGHSPDRGTDGSTD